MIRSDVVHSNRKGIYYLCKWNENKYKFIGSTEAKSKWPHLMFDFFEKKLIESFEADSITLVEERMGK